MAEAEGAPVGIMGSALAAERLARRADGGRAKAAPVRTPYGSVDVIQGEAGGARFAAVAKSQAAPFPPHRLPFRATLAALAKAGCLRVLSASVVTSLDGSVRIADVVVPDDYIDFTGRAVTFFDGGREGTHQADMGAPFCRRLAREFTSSARSFGLRVVEGGTVATVQGPHQPTGAEAARLAGEGAVAASFSAATEAKLARELGLCLVAAGVVVRQAEGGGPWRQARGREQDAGAEGAGPTEAELLRAFAEGREAPRRAAAPSRGGREVRARAPRGPRAREAREAEALRAALRDVDRRLEDAAAAFVPQAAALPPCPYCPRGAGPPRE